MRTITMTLASGALAVSVVLAGAVPARAADAVLYELTESQKIMGGKVTKLASSSALAGWIVPGSTLCPTDVAQQFGSPRGCYVNATASNRIDTSTGIGPASGSFAVVIQDRNKVDAPEVMIATGTLDGQMDLSPAVLHNIPLGTITGRWRVTGVKGGPMDGVTGHGGFTGVFRLPFVDPKPPHCADTGDVTGCLPESLVPVYLDASGVPVPIAATEYALGIPAVRLEITLQ